METGGDRTEGLAEGSTIVASGIVFFFSSRRRHTRFDCDWSSDVCSSDLKDERVRRATLRKSRLESLCASRTTFGSFNLRPLGATPFKPSVSPLTSLN